MRFGQDLHRLLDCILDTDPVVGPGFLSKVDIAGAYMHIWVRLNEIPSIVLLIPKEKEEEDQLVVFQLAIPMGYVELVPLFCAATEMIK